MNINISLFCLLSELEHKDQYFIKYSILVSHSLTLYLSVSTYTALHFMMMEFHQIFERFIAKGFCFLVKDKVWLRI